MFSKKETEDYESELDESELEEVKKSITEEEEKIPKESATDKIKNALGVGKKSNPSTSSGQERKLRKKKCQSEREEARSALTHLRHCHYLKKIKVNQTPATLKRMPILSREHLQISALKLRWMRSSRALLYPLCFKASGRDEAFSYRRFTK